MISFWCIFWKKQKWRSLFPLKCRLRYVVWDDTFFKYASAHASENTDRVGISERKRHLFKPKQKWLGIIPSPQAITGTLCNMCTYKNNLKFLKFYKRLSRHGSSVWSCRLYTRVCICKFDSFWPSRRECTRRVSMTKMIMELLAWSPRDWSVVKWLEFWNDREWEWESKNPCQVR